MRRMVVPSGLGSSADSASRALNPCLVCVKANFAFVLNRGLRE